MMETTNDLDNQLGVKKLVPSHNSTSKVNIMTSGTSLNKLRQNHTLDHWSSNNGSVIYAQPPTNHHSSNKYLKGTNGTQNILVESRKVEGSQRYNPINSSLGELNTTQRAAPQYKGVKSKASDHSNGVGGEDLSGEDLKNNKTESVAKWSNGSGTTSDLLF